MSRIIHFAYPAYETKPERGPVQEITDREIMTRRRQMVEELAAEGRADKPAPVWLACLICFLIGLGTGVTLISLI